jgi:hypothetical protein
MVSWSIRANNKSRLAVKMLTYTRVRNLLHAIVDFCPTAVCTRQTSVILNGFTDTPTAWLPSTREIDKAKITDATAPSDNIQPLQQRRARKHYDVVIVVSGSGDKRFDWMYYVS